MLEKKITVNLYPSLQGYLKALYLHFIDNFELLLSLLGKKNDISLFYLYFLNY